MNSTEYWIERYKRGGTSGLGSEGMLAAYKAHEINFFIVMNKIETIIDWGCGDGCLPLVSQSYIGFDVSTVALDIAKKRSFNRSNDYYLIDEYDGQTADLTLSLDVIYHLLEDSLYHEYMKRLFESSDQYVIIYSSNFEARQVRHERRRRFTDWLDENLRVDQDGSEWTQIDYIKNRLHMLTYSDFYIYKRDQ